MSKSQSNEYAEALRGQLKPGDIIYTILNHVSRSGMQREITLVHIVDNEPQYLSYQAAKVLDWPLGKESSIKVRGAGMDMGFHTVYSLSQALFGDGYALKQRWL